MSIAAPVFVVGSLLVLITKLGIILTGGFFVDIDRDGGFFESRAMLSGDVGETNRPRGVPFVANLADITFADVRIVLFAHTLVSVEHLLGVGMVANAAVLRRGHRRPGSPSEILFRCLLGLLDNLRVLDVNVPVDDVLAGEALLADGAAVLLDDKVEILLAESLVIHRVVFADHAEKPAPFALEAARALFLVLFQLDAQLERDATRDASQLLGLCGLDGLVSRLGTANAFMLRERYFKIVIGDHRLGFSGDGHRRVALVFASSTDVLVVRVWSSDGGCSAVEGLVPPRDPDLERVEDVGRLRPVFPEQIVNAYLVIGAQVVEHDVGEDAALGRLEVAVAALVAVANVLAVDGTTHLVVVDVTD